MGEITNYKKVFENTDDTEPGVSISSVGLQEQTKQRFRDILNIKEIKTINDGLKLNSNNLLSFFTGNIEELFTEDKIEHIKKSKIMFLLDCSGSMETPMIDEQPRYRVLASTVKGITDLLDEIHQLEGLNVDYELRAFDHCYYELPKENWEDEYIKYAINGGTTYIYEAFKKANDELLNDWTITGHRLMIILTDGAVDDGEIQNIQKLMLHYNQDVRLMFIGVGANPQQSFIAKITPHNILAQELADVEILNACLTML